MGTFLDYTAKYNGFLEAAGFAKKFAPTPTAPMLDLELPSGYGEFHKRLVLKTLIRLCCEATQGAPCPLGIPADATLYGMSVQEFRGLGHRIAQARKAMQAGPPDMTATLLQTRELLPQQLREEYGRYNVPIAPPDTHDLAVPGREKTPRVRNNTPKNKQPHEAALLAATPKPVSNALLGAGLLALRQKARLTSKAVADKLREQGVEIFSPQLSNMKSGLFHPDFTFQKTLDFARAAYKFVGTAQDLQELGVRHNLKTYPPMSLNPKHLGSGFRMLRAKSQMEPDAIIEKMCKAGIRVNATECTQLLARLETGVPLAELDFALTVAKAVYGFSGKANELATSGRVYQHLYHAANRSITR